MKKDIKETGMQ